MPYIIPNLSYMWPYFSTILGPYQEGKPKWDGWYWYLQPEAVWRSGKLAGKRAFA